MCDEYLGLSFIHNHKTAHSLCWLVESSSSLYKQPKHLKCMQSWSDRQRRNTKQKKHHK